MGVIKILIIIDQVPISKNSYVNMHWASRREYKERISWLIYEQKMFEKSIKPREYAELPYNKATINIDIFFKDKRKRDVANYMGGGLIAWLDVLVDLQYIKDDSYDYIKQPLISFNIDKIYPRTEIRIDRR